MRQTMPFAAIVCPEENGIENFAHIDPSLSAPATVLRFSGWNKGRHEVSPLGLQTGPLLITEVGFVRLAFHDEAIDDAPSLDSNFLP